MVCLYGMQEKFGLFSVRQAQKGGLGLGNSLLDDANRATRDMLIEEMEKTSKLLMQHKERLDAIADALLARERLTSEDLRDILPPDRNIAGLDEEGYDA